MPSLCVVGMQWGDEGKGKLIDFLTAQADLVVRYQGGSNAGHTVVVEGLKTVLHLLPSGILHDGCTCVIGNSVVIDPEGLLEEIELVRSRGLTVADNLLISDRAQVVMPYHKALDKASEEAKGDAKIGTTLRGIGPAYVDKVNRSGIRMVDLVKPASFEAKLRANLASANVVLERVYGHEPLVVAPILDAYLAYGEVLRPHVTDTVLVLNQAIAEGKKLLFEGAQGALLDIDFGTYPFVTSSNSSVCGVPAGTGVAPRHIARALGVVKAYTTRVGEGPFPSELLCEMGEALREKGGEYGATTGRPRRCGWLDAVALRYTILFNGTNYVAVTKLDVLDGLPTVRICTAYECDGVVRDTFPSDLDELAKCTPVYEDVPGWQEDTTGAQSIDDLPANARAYLDRMAELLGVPVRIVSVGTDRRQTMFVGEGDLFG